jgi:hypothetical protein
MNADARFPASAFISVHLRLLNCPSPLFHNSSIDNNRLRCRAASDRSARHAGTHPSHPTLCFCALVVRHPPDGGIMSPKMRFTTKFPQHNSLARGISSPMPGQREVVRPCDLAPFVTLPLRLEPLTTLLPHGTLLPAKCPQSAEIRGPLLVPSCLRPHEIKR